MRPCSWYIPFSNLTPLYLIVIHHQSSVLLFLRSLEFCNTFPCLPQPICDWMFCVYALVDTITSGAVFRDTIITRATIYLCVFVWNTNTDFLPAVTAYCHLNNQSITTKILFYGKTLNCTLGRSDKLHRLIACFSSAA